MEHVNYTVLAHEDEELQVISVGQEPWFVVSDIDRILGPSDVNGFNDYANKNKHKIVAKTAKIIGENKSEKFEYVINLEGALTFFEIGEKFAKDKSNRDQCSIFIDICKSMVPAFLANLPKAVAKV